MITVHFIMVFDYRSAPFTIENVKQILAWNKAI